MGLPQAGPDQIFSSAIFYQSFVAGLGHFITCLPTGRFAFCFN
jgi:hypothetical protein